MPIIARAHSTSCSNCGLPEAHLAVQVRRKAEGRYGRETCITESFCGQECVMQTAFLRLERRSIKGTITRFLNGRPIRYAEFRQIVLSAASGHRPITTSHLIVASTQKEDSNVTTSGSKQ